MEAMSNEQALGLTQRSTEPAAEFQDVARNVIRMRHQFIHNQFDSKRAEMAELIERKTDRTLRVASYIEGGFPHCVPFIQLCEQRMVKRRLRFYIIRPSRVHCCVPTSGAKHAMRRWPRNRAFLWWRHRSISACAQAQ